MTSIVRLGFTHGNDIFSEAIARGLAVHPREVVCLRFPVSRAVFEVSHCNGGYNVSTGVLKAIEGELRDWGVICTGEFPWGLIARHYQEVCREEGRRVNRRLLKLLTGHFEARQAA